MHSQNRWSLFSSGLLTQLKISAFIFTLFMCLLPSSVLPILHHIATIPSLVCSTSWATFADGSYCWALLILCVFLRGLSNFFPVYAILSLPVPGLFSFSKGFYTFPLLWRNILQSRFIPNLCFFHNSVFSPFITVSLIWCLSPWVQFFF